MLPFKVSTAVVCSLVVSFCSMGYELSLAQCLSSLFGNTVIQYSLTIGIYLAAMGFGALATDHVNLTDPLKGLFLVEIVLTLLGVSSPILIIAADSAITAFVPALTVGWTSMVSQILAYTVVFVIGLLSGAEIPLLLRLVKEDASRGIVLGADFFGTFVGALAFPLLLYPTLGLFGTAATLGTINLMIAFGICVLSPARQSWYSPALLVLGGLTVIPLLVWSKEIAKTMSNLLF